MRIVQVITEYLRYLETLGRSPFTIRQAGFDLRHFARFMGQIKVALIEELCPEVIREYQQELCFSLTAKAKPLSIRTQTKRLCTMKGFTRYLKDADYLAADPGERIKLPKEPRPLPRAILTDVDIRKMLKAPDVHTNRGYRNRVVLEILYDTGIRRLEVSHLRVGDMDLDGGYLRIHGKGDKERVVPVSQRVCGLIKNYTLSVRPWFVNGKDTGHLILNRWGQQMDPNGIWAIVKRCAVLAGIKKNVTTHSFRHTCATHMLKNGAPIRHIQELLGHESLESTQIYTRLTINDLKTVHSKYHPGERVEA